MSRTHGNREFEGENLEEALAKAAKALEVDEAELDYEILEQGRRGLWGIGHKSVRIRVMPPIQPIDADHAELTTDAITGGRSRSRRGRGGRGRSRGGQGGGARGGDPTRQPQAGGGNAGGRRRDAGNRAEGGGRGGARKRGGGGGRPDGAKRADAGGNREEGRTTGRRRRRRSRGSGRRGSGGERGPRGEGQRQKRADLPDVPAEEAAKVEAGLQKIVDLMGLDVRAELAEVTSTVALELKGPDEEFLNGTDSELLSSLEFLLNRMSRRSWPEATRIHVGSNGQRTRRDEEVIELVKEVAQQVKQTGESKRLHAMNSYERRLAHLTIREMTGLGSRSEGEGPVKKVRIYRQRGADPSSPDVPEAPDVSPESESRDVAETPETRETSDS